MIFKGDPRTLYKNEVKMLEVWGEAISIFNERYNSEAKQRKLIDILKDVTIDD